MHFIEHALVQLNDVNVIINGSVILQQINLHIAPQEIISIIGPNGAGKSTLVKTVLGIQAVSHGTLYKRADLVCAYVPQNFNPSPTLPLRVKDLLQLERPDQQHYLAIINELNLSALLNHSIHLLSGGEKQRILIARALIRRPNLLVLDEPMQGLDIQHESELNAYIRNLPNTHGCAILMVSHDLQWVMQGTERVICLNKHICCQGHPDSVQQHPEYVALFGREHSFYQHHHDHCQHDSPHIQSKD